jgi:hypothetical protein
VTSATRDVSAIVLVLFQRLANNGCITIQAGLRQFLAHPNHDKNPISAATGEFAIMAGAEASEAGLCEACGTALTGNFCSGCGAPVDNTTAEGWSSLANQLLSKPRPNGILSVALSFLRHPVDTIIRLTDDPTYRSQWAFLSTCLGAQLTLSYVLLPRLYSALLGVPDTADTSAVITNEIVQYVGIAILTPIQFYVCRALGTRPRTPMSYVKLCALSVSYCTIIATAVALIIFAAGVIAAKTTAGIDMQTVGLSVMSAAMLIIVIFVAMTHRIFWGMRRWVALAVTLAIAALSWGVVYPFLTTLAERAGISTSIGRFLG